MLRLLKNTSTSVIRLAIPKAILKVPCLTAVRKMSSGNPSARTNEDLKSNKLFDVSHITAVVTGGGAGIGLMIAQALFTNGAKVYITDRREEALQKVVEQYNTGPGRLISLPCDISKKDEIIRLADEVASKETKGIHLLVNNAGIARDNNTRYDKNEKPDFSSPKAISEHMLRSEPEHWADTFQTNITAQYFTSAAFLPLLEKGGNVTPGYTSSIVNVASISGVMKGTSMGQFSYATSKAGT